MTREEARQIIATWLVSSKGTKGQRGYIEGWFDEEDVEAFRMAIEALEVETQSDLISRADAITQFCEFGTESERNGKLLITMVDAKYAFIKTLESLPIINGVEVVRCKDCKHYKPFDKSKKFDCPQGLYAVFENDYCSHGERSEE